MATQNSSLKTQNSKWQLLRMAVAGTEQEFTSGSIDRAIFLLAIPMILEMMMESLFAVVDIFFVSKISEEAVSTVGATESFLTFMYSIAIGMSAAATAMVSRRIGEQNRAGAAEAAGQVVLIGLAFSLILAVPGYFFADDVLRLMTKDPAVAEHGQHYARIMFTANLPIFFLWMLNGVFRGAGDASTAMRALWIANAVNIVLDPLFIFGIGPFPELGVTGAAVATTIGRSTGVAYQLWHLFRVGKIVHVRREHLRPVWSLIRRLLDLASGSAGQFLIGSASWVFLMWILGQCGTNVQAGYTIAIRIIIFTILPAWGMANAAATLVGQNLGAGKPDRAEKSVWRTAVLNMIFMGIVGAVYMIWAPFFIGLFAQNLEVIASGSMALRIIAGGYVCFGYGMILTQSLNGAGDTKTPTLLNFIFFWLIEIPLAWLLALHWNWGESGAYWSIVIAETLLALTVIWVFRQGKWKTVKV